MTPNTIFLIDMTLGYLASALCIGTYVWPRLKGMDRLEAQRAIATLHSFRFFGLVFLLPGFVGPNLPHAFAAPAAYGDFAAGVLAILALLTVAYSVVGKRMVVHAATVQAPRFVGFAGVQRSGVVVGENRDGADTHFGGRADDANRNLAAVGDQKTARDHIALVSFSARRISRLNCI